jgi:hypothetical protein
LVFGERDLVSERLKLSQSALASPRSQAFVEQGGIGVTASVVPQ